MESGLCTCLSGVSEQETAIFTMTKDKIYVCNGKKCKRLDFLTMTKVNFRNFMVKSGQGRCEETSEPFCCPFGQTPRRPRALRDPNFATMSLSRGRVRMNHNRKGTSSHDVFHAHFACTEKGTPTFTCDAPCFFIY